MSASTKLSTAVKAICYLAEAAPEPRTSAEISEHIGANASKLRKIFSLLVKSGIIESSYGAAGGFLLKKDPSVLHLQEIYCAIEDRKAFDLNTSQNSSAEADINSRLNNYFLDLFADVQVDIENKMRQITIKSILTKVNHQ